MGVPVSPRNFVLTCTTSPLIFNSGFSHRCVDAVQKRRAKNYVHMRKLTRQDRLNNDEQAEIDRLGQRKDIEKEKEEHHKQAMESGGIDDDSCSEASNN